MFIEIMIRTMINGAPYEKFARANTNTGKADIEKRFNALLKEIIELKEEYEKQKSPALAGP